MEGGVSAGDTASVGGVPGCWETGVALAQAVTAAANIGTAIASTRIVGTSIDTILIAEINLNPGDQHLR